MHPERQDAAAGSARPSGLLVAIPTPYRAFSGPQPRPSHRTSPYGGHVFGISVQQNPILAGNVLFAKAIDAALNLSVSIVRPSATRCLHPGRIKQRPEATFVKQTLAAAIRSWDVSANVPSRSKITVFMHVPCAVLTTSVTQRHGMKP
jgi:hypothetical protein